MLLVNQNNVVDAKSVNASLIALKNQADKLNRQIATLEKSIKSLDGSKAAEKDLNNYYTKDETYNKQSIDTNFASKTDLLSFIKTKTINILFNSVTWTKSNSGIYYCYFYFSSYITETINNVISVDLSEFDNLRETDNIQVMTASNARFLLVSNTNSFAYSGSGIYLRISYI